MPAIAAGTVIDWENMFPEYTGQETQDQMNAVATLSMLCGAAVEMDYTSKSSSAWVSEEAWEDIFDYDAELASESRGDYRLAAWNQKVYDELAARRPVLYVGFSSTSGHSFVIDGYGADDYFHVNWGWSGCGNGYYLLSILDPENTTSIGASSSPDGYSLIQSAIFGIQPNTGAAPTATPPVMSSFAVSLPEGTEYTRSSADDDFTFPISFSYYNPTKEPCSFEFAVGLFDTHDNLLGVAVEDWYYYDDLPSYVGWGVGAINYQVAFGSGLANGVYWVKPISCERGTDTWYPNIGSDKCYVEAEIHDNTLTLRVPTFALTGTMEFGGKKEQGSTVTVTANITNNGTFFNDQILLLVNGDTDDKVVAGRYLDMDAKETTTLNFSFTPKETGENVVTLCTRAWNGDAQKYEYTPFITGSVTIDEASAATLTMLPVTKNAEKVGGQNVVKDSKAIISIDITNTGDTDYDNDVIVRLYKMTSESSGNFDHNVRKAVHVAAGATTNVEIEIDNLEDGKTYFYLVKYLSGGEQVQGYSRTPIFTVQIPTAISALSNHKNAAVQVFSLDGRKQADAQEADLSRVLNTLPKGVYIIRVDGASKIVRN